MLLAKIDEHCAAVIVTIVVVLVLLECVLQQIARIFQLRSVLLIVIVIAAILSGRERFHRSGFKKRLRSGRGRWTFHISVTILGCLIVGCRFFRDIIVFFVQILIVVVAILSLSSSSETYK